MRDQIIAEIQRIAADLGGKAPGRQVFERETGIKQSAWRGVFWARWSDAIHDAGLDANVRQGRTDRNFMLEKLATAVRHYGRPPVYAELRMFGRIDPDFPAHTTISNSFHNKEDMIDAIRSWVSDRPDFSDVSTMLPPVAAVAQIPVMTRPTSKIAEGHVYLIKSGDFYKIGRSDELERRVKEIRIALPDTATLVHSIRTDDPPGIEAYWHRRFAAQRANGEWFKLSTADVAAFRRRKYQ